MFDRIVIPLDGTPESETVLSAVQRILAPDGEVHLLHVIPGISPPPELPAALLSLPEHAERYLYGVASRMPAARVRIFVDVGDPAERIVRIAQAIHAGAIAMTTHARRGVSRAVVGSVAHRVVRSAGMPVLLVRPEGAVAAATLRRILVPLDGSDRSARILDVVAPLARKCGSEVVLLHVLPPEVDPMAGVLPDRPIRLVTHDIRRQYEELAGALSGSGVAARAVVVRGKAVKEILRQGREAEVDLIAMATHGRTGLDRVLAGSVTEGVLRRADRPVLVLRSQVPSARPEVRTGAAE